MNNKTKTEKLNEVYEYIRTLGEIHTKKDFANKIEFDKANLSSAFNGDERYLTDGLFKKICEKYPDLFNVNYFLKDEGKMTKNIVNQSNVQGDNIQGHNVTVNKSQTDKFLDLLKTKDDQLKKCQVQIDRLIGIIEKLNKQRTKK
ncbi:MAG: hypothetical protein LBK94_09795 [Prevotellaceae bacterium]|jgi:hypothetical protein|nr:hypothetical protein [Prevotellaceae bacterium]